MTVIPSAVENHYSRADLEDRILAALRAAGKDPDALSHADLVPFDQFHTRGHEATVELAELAGLRPGQELLDVGSGIGGPARTLAAEFGCRVVGIDLTESFCRVAEQLTARVGLAGRAGFRQGDALALPFGDESFDVVWSQHAAMNIADKARLYAECRRVLRRDGRLAIHDILAGPAGTGDVHFPLPWASSPEISFLVSAGELRALLAAAGFRELVWRDRTAETIDWFREIEARRQGLPPGSPPPPGPALLMGADFQVRLGNVRRNLEERRLAVAQVVAARAD